MSEPAMCVIFDSTECDRWRVHEAASKDFNLMAKMKVTPLN